jgi:C-terminal processing protease CtpA/Prc
VGDYILSVDGVSLTGHSIAQVDAAISDEPGRQVTFRVRRQGTVMEKTLTVAEGPLASGIWPGPVWRQATP